jgi:hypothetical protein
MNNFLPLLGHIRALRVQSASTFRVGGGKREKKKKGQQGFLAVLKVKNAKLVNFPHIIKPDNLRFRFPSCYSCIYIATFLLFILLLILIGFAHVRK